MKNSRRSFLLKSLAGLPAINLLGRAVTAEESPIELYKAKHGLGQTGAMYCASCGVECRSSHGNVPGVADVLCSPHWENARALGANDEAFTMFRHGILAGRVCEGADLTGRGFLKVSVPFVSTEHRRLKFSATEQRVLMGYEPTVYPETKAKILEGDLRDLLLWAEPVMSMAGPVKRLERDTYNPGSVVRVLPAPAPEVGSTIFVAREGLRVYYGMLKTFSCPATGGRVVGGRA